MSRRARPAKSEASEERFAAEYMACGQNATQAYLRTHPNSGQGSARANAARMIAKDSVRKKIRAARRRLAKETGVKSKELVAELVKIAFSDIGDVFDFTGDVVRLRSGDAISPEARQAIAGLEVTETTRDGKTTVRAKVRMADKVKAIECLARMLGLFEGPPPLEQFVATLPSALALELRTAMRLAVVEQGATVPIPS